MSKTFPARSIATALLCIAIGTATHAQITGGRNSFQYLQLPGAPHISAMGGYGVSSLAQEVAFAMQNPGMLTNKMHNQLGLSYNLYYADIGMLNLQYANYNQRLKTNFALGLQYINYGSMIETDAFGNQLGNIRASDMSLQLSASRQYLKYWHYGATLKVAYSNLATRSAVATLVDVGVHYHNPEKLFSFGMVAKNIGVTLKKYNSDNKAEPLPFDFEIGVMKGLQNLPLRFFAVAHHLYEWDIRYNDPALQKTTDIFGNTVAGSNDKKIADKIFRHLNLGAELVLAKRVTATVGYSQLRRGELAYELAKGAAGFSFGLGIDLNKIKVNYARGYYGSAGAYNELGFSFQLNKLIKGNTNMKARGWDMEY